MDKRNRIARALSEADISGPDDFDLADEMERNMYDRMALAALNNAHLYAVHTVDTPTTFIALASVSGELTITRDGDQFAEWGEQAGPKDPRHLVIGASDPWVVRNIVRGLSRHDLPVTVTEHADWAEDVEQETGASTIEHRTWGEWMRADGGFDSY